MDSHTEGQLGGTGRIHDWRVSREIRDFISPQSLILAGGLTELNVAEAIRKVGPYSVDVSSGIEAKPGVKDQRDALQELLSPHHILFLDLRRHQTPTHSNIFS